MKLPSERIQEIIDRELTDFPSSGFEWQDKVNALAVAHNAVVEYLDEQQKDPHGGKRQE